MIVWGLAIGTIAAFPASEALRGFLFDVQPRDASVLLLVPAVVVCVGALACYLPARRATRIDPVTALRAE
jgi:putative ABC transport system permease protein